jgi:hypothetical protein
MSDPKHRPRDLAVYPRTFGSGGVAEWRSDSPIALVSAARLQHNLSNRLALHMKKNNLTAASLGAKLGWSADRLGRLLRGEQAMRLDDVTSVLILIEVSLSLHEKPDAIRAAANDALDSNRQV